MNSPVAVLNVYCVPEDEISLPLESKSVYDFTVQQLGLLFVT
jgi:hypothetical protein